MDLAEIAFKIVHNVAKLKENEVVSLSGEINNLSNDKPLSQIPLIEEIALSVRKNKSFPILEISTLNLKKRTLNELPDDLFSFPTEFYEKWMKVIDIFIDFTWNNPTIFNNISDQIVQNINNQIKKTWGIFTEQNKKMILMAFPTKDFADYYHLDYQSLLNSYFKGLNCDYNKIREKSIEISETLSFRSNLAIYSQEHSSLLNISLEISKSEIFDGDSSKRTITILPTGNMEIPLKKEFLNGIFSAEKIYYKQTSFENISFDIANGEIINIFGNTNQNNIGKLNQLIYQLKNNWKIVIGLNENLSAFSGYSLYDLSVNGTLSIVNQDEKGHQLILISKSSKIVNKNSKIEIVRY
jgi:leucyl aminopeptidase (aminopeptidase T)